MNWLEIKNKYKVKSYFGETLDFGDGFFVDCIQMPDCWEAWIYHCDYGIKELMFGTPDDFNIVEFIEVVIANFPEYRDIYVDRVMEEEL